MGENTLCISYKEIFDFFFAHTKNNNDKISPSYFSFNAQRNVILIRSKFSTRNNYSILVKCFSSARLPHIYVAFYNK